MTAPSFTTRVERPADQRGTLLHRPPADRFPVGARLYVAPDECAVVTSHGRVLGTLGPGNHALDPAVAPFLAPAIDLVAGGRELVCELYLLLMGTFTGITVEGPLGELRDDSGEPVPVWVAATIDVALGDPERLVGSLAARRDDPLEAVRFHAVRGLRATLDTLVKRGELVARTISRDAAKVRRAAESTGLGLAEIGIRLVALPSLELYRERPATVAAARPAPPAAAELAWVIPNVPHRDLGTGLTVGVTFHGTLVGSPVPPSQVQWVIDGIGELLYALAADYGGQVLDIPSHAAELSALLTERLVPRFASASLAGRVTVTGFELPPGDPAVAELHRRYGR